MKNFILFMLIGFSLQSCLKEDTAHEMEIDSITKEEVLKVCYSADLKSTTDFHGIEFEEAMKMVLSFNEIEEVLIDYVNRINYPNTLKGKLLKQFFDDFKSETGISYLQNESEQKKEEFAERFFATEVSKVDGDYNEKIVCSFPDLDCPLLPNNGCTEESNLIYYTQKKPCYSPIVATDCARTVGTPDCDHSYHWGISQSVFNNNTPNAFVWHWYTSNSVYRALMPSSISGYKISVTTGGNTSFYASIFLGWKHRTAMYFSYLPTCQQDKWIADTRFTYFYATNETKK